MSCDCCTGLGCRRCEPQICEVCDTVIDFVEDHADCLEAT